MWERVDTDRKTGQGCAQSSEHRAFCRVGSWTPHPRMRQRQGQKDGDTAIETETPNPCKNTPLPRPRRKCWYSANGKVKVFIQRERRRRYRCRTPMSLTRRGGNTATHTHTGALLRLCVCACVLHTSHGARARQRIILWLHTASDISKVLIVDSVSVSHSVARALSMSAISLSLRCNAALCTAGTQHC